MRSAASWVSMSSRSSDTGMRLASSRSTASAESSSSSGGATTRPAACAEAKLWSVSSPKRASRSCAASGSSITTSASAGRYSKTVSTPGWIHGASASEPGGSEPRSSASSVSSVARASAPCSSARLRISALRSITRSRSSWISRGGGSVTEPSRCCERWLAASKSRIDSTSSPVSSMRTGCVRCGGKTSTMPPRTATSPRSSTSAMRA